MNNIEVNVSELVESQYLRFMNAKWGICTDDDYRDYKKNPHNLMFEELWWNNVSLRTAKPCRKCKADLYAFNKLVENDDIEAIQNFDTNKSKLRLCSHPCCLWSKYFIARRNKTDVIHQPIITLKALYFGKGL